MASSASAPKPSSILEIDQIFYSSLYLLLVTGFFSLAMTGKMDIASVLFVAGAFVYRGFLLVRRIDRRIPERWTSLLGLIYLGVYASDFFLISQNFVSASVHLVLFAMVVKLFSCHRERDYVYLTALAFLELLAAAILTIDSAFLVVFAFFLALAVVTFITMEMRRSANAASHSARAQILGSHSQVVALVGRMAILLVLGILVLSAGIFFTLPRLSYGYLAKFVQQNNLNSGFSDTVNLGAIGRIQQSNQAVMHVKIDGDTTGNHQLRLRGAVLSLFDGKRWMNPNHERDLATGSMGRYELGMRSNLSFNDRLLRQMATNQQRHNIIHYRVLMEPIGTEVIFLVPVPRTLEGRIREIGIDSENTAINLDHDRMTSAYEGTSDISQPDAEQLRSGGIPPPPLLTEKYLMVPPIDPRVAQLTHELTDRQTTVYDKAATLESYLRRSFSYTLDLPDPPPADPIANFLFVRKQGHCEYFASAMAIMLRQAGIPSRVITGFHGGEFNDLTNSYVIRARDAHAWVEAYIPGSGWTTFDPTPATIGTQKLSAWDRISLYTDAAREFWREWVVNYDFQHQRNLTVQTVSKTRNTVENASKWIKERYRRMVAFTRRASEEVTHNPQKSGTSVLVALVLLIAFINIPPFVRFCRQAQIARNTKTQPQSAAAIWYSRMERTVARRGWTRHPAQTPPEFANAIADAELRMKIKRFTKHYERARFDNSAEDASALPELYEEISKHHGKG